MVPFSVVIITQGQEELLTKSLESLRSAPSNFELIMISHGHPLSENLEKLGRSVARDFKFLHFSTAVSPGKARNEALKLASSEWIHFLNENCYWTKNYWEIVKDLLTDPCLVILGGPDRAASPMSFFQQCVAIALSSPLCTGITFSRHRSTGKGIQTASEENLSSANLWIRRKVLGTSPFPEDYKRAEENYFLQKLTSEGKRLSYHPQLVVGHFREKKLYSLLSWAFSGGYWRSHLLKERLTKEAMIFWLPSLFVLFHLAYGFDSFFFFEVAKIYAGVVLVVSLGLSSRESNVFLFPVVALLHYFIVFTYGLGFLAERMGAKSKLASKF